MAYLVTGGTGFIGSHLVDRLLSSGESVIVVDDFSLGKEGNLSHHKNNPKLTIHKKSILDDLSDLFKKGVKCVFHVAALPRVQFSIKNPMETHNVNVNGTLNLLNECRKYGVKRFVFSSSSSIYGGQDKMPFKEDMVPNPMSPYALHKLVGEYYCKIFNSIYGLETVGLRYFNVYGPRQSPEGGYACLIPRFIKSISEGQPPTINGGGNQTRDFTFVSDVVEANILASETKNKNCFGQAFNIGSGRNISVNQVTESIIKLSGKKIKPIYGPPVIEPKNTLADIEKSKKMLGWKPKTSFEDGLKETYLSMTA